jgi:hypothetical protein
LYGQIYGDRIESTLACEGCAELFDIHFSLKQLLATVADRPRSMEIQAAGENLFETSAGWRFRLPTGRDEREAGAFGLPDSEGILLGRCMVNEAPCPDASAIQAALEELAPLVDLELRAQCPECGHIRFLQFDIQTYLLGSLVQDQTRLAFEIHRIAAAYGWCLNEILSLTRTERRRMVELIENEPAQPARAFR